MTFPEEPRTIAELEQRIAESRAALDARVTGLSEAELERPAADGGWSVRDHLAHVTAWELGTIALLEGRSRAEAMGVSEEDWASGDVDRVNAAVHAARAGMTTSEVVEAYHGTHQRLTAVIGALSDADLQRPYQTFQAGGDDAPIINWIAGNTYGHYDEHVPWIDRLLGAP